MGVAVDNCGSANDYQPSGGHWEIKLQHHHQNNNIDAWSTALTESQWVSIVTSAWSSDTDAQFYAVVYSMVPGWAYTHMDQAGLTSAYRTNVKKLAPQV